MKSETKKIFFMLLILAIISGSLYSQINVRHITSGTDISAKQGVVYTLPYTLFRVDLEVLKTEYIAGPYSEYAAKYLDLQDVNTSNYDEYVIADASIKTVAVPDPQQVYFAEITDKIVKEDRSLLLSLSNAGLIADLQGNLPKGLEKSFPSINYQSDPSTKDLFSYFAGTNLLEKVDTIIRKVTVDTVTVEKIYLDKKWVEKGNEQKAIDAANKIEKIRESRYNLLTGYQEIAYPAGTIEFMDEQLKKMEKEYLSLFTGIAIKKKLFFTFFVDPEMPEQGNKIPVCVFSERSGVKAPDASGGEKLFLEINETGDFEGITMVINQKIASAPAEKGYFYRIPKTVEVNMKLNNDLQLQGLFPVSQYGTVSFLPPTITSVQFHPETGAIKTMFVE